jgi:hypothetical protein
MSKARDIASAAPAPSTVSATEIGYLDGVTSAIQTQLDAKTAKSTLTTTGDIYYASAANTPARLGIGTASQILAVNSGATAPEWVAAPSSGGMTLISTTTIGTTVSSVTVSGAFSATYDNYLVTLQINSASASTSNAIQLGSTTTGYYGNAIYMDPTSNTVNGIGYNNSSSAFSGYHNATNGGTSIIHILQPNLAKRTAILISGTSFNTSGSTTMKSEIIENSNTQHTAFTFVLASGTITGGTIRVYGYQNS